MDTNDRKKIKICCVSIKYSKPDIFSELVAFGQQAEKMGCEISYIFSEHCKWLADELYGKINAQFLGSSIDTKTMILDTLKFYFVERTKIKKMFNSILPDIVFFGNMHPANKFLAFIASKTGCKEIWWWLHEPYRNNKAEYGLWQRYYYAFAELFQPGFLKIVDRILLSSQRAKAIFSERFSWYKGKVIQVPLILMDYYEPNSASNNEYVSFVGSAVPAKGVDIFFDLVEYSSEKQQQLKFQIITPSDISNCLNRLSISAKNRLKVVSGKRISDVELGRAVRNSVVVMTPYRQTMQSGVVPVAFMHGVPVISTDVGSMPEFVRPGETGVLLPVDASLENWLNGILKIKENRDVIGKKCRKFYENYHSPSCWLKVCPELFDKLK